jgi:hypothetical protein
MSTDILQGLGHGQTSRGSLFLLFSFAFLGLHLPYGITFASIPMRSDDGSLAGELAGERSIGN